MILQCQVHVKELLNTMVLGKKKKCNENLIKSLFVIMSSHDDLLSSDESVISVANYINPFGDIKVDNIPMEIVEDLHTAEEDDSVRVCL